MIPAFMLILFFVGLSGKETESVRIILYAVDHVTYVAPMWTVSEWNCASRRGSTARVRGRQQTSRAHHLVCRCITTEDIVKAATSSRYRSSLAMVCNNWTTVIRAVSSLLLRCSLVLHFIRLGLTHR